MRSIIGILATILGLLAQDCGADLLPAHQRNNPWFRDGVRHSTAAPADVAPAGGARNIILFVGDGMSVTTVTAARILAGQRAGGSGEEHLLSFETFPHTALVRTYNTDAQTPDSAGTMSAMMTGTKTRIGMFGVGPDAIRGDCQSQQGNTLPSYLELAEVAGMATGVISTARITHATPAATYAYSVDRNWEDDSDLPITARGQCEDIASQLVSFEARVERTWGVDVDGIEVAMGGGRRHFLPADAAYNSADADSAVEGDREDGRDLVGLWQQQYPDGAVLFDSADFAAADPENTPRVLGLFAESHVRYEADRHNDPAGEPSLAEQTALAIRMLSRDPDGFFLMVEGGRIDHAHHAGNAYHALHDTLAMADAVAVAMAETDPADTLIVVTADHGHVMSMAGYPRRGNPILGLVVGIGQDTPTLAADGRPYTTLSYANGAGMRDFGALASPDAAPRQAGAARSEGRDLAEIDTEAPGFFQEALVPIPGETHSGDDVAVYASGPGADTLPAVIEQDAIFDLLNAGRDVRRARP